MVPDTYFPLDPYCVEPKHCRSKMLHFRIPIASLLVFLLSRVALSDSPPATPREFRAAWVATVANIDWPSKSSLSVDAQRKEMIAILDCAKKANLNAIVFQVRTSADAFYDSKLEPWSEFLTGTQGKTPEPYYDPLSIWIEESHARGIELHAWFNPYRARHTAAKSSNAPNHVANTIPNAVKEYGGYLWLDPSEPEASSQTLNVVLDIVRRYDIDGIHMDDYFYPYPVNQPGSKPAVELPFPDDAAWNKYLANNERPKLSRDQWRRRNVDQLIETIYKAVKAEKQHVKLGISPFGIGKPAMRPEGIVGFSQYDKLYADAELWLEKGWLDYFSPQLYWPIDQKPQAFGVLLDYWSNRNPLKRHLWSGLYTSSITDSDKSWLPSEIVDQVLLIRNKGEANSELLGHIHFSMKALLENRKGILDDLKASLYRQPALVPASPWLDPNPPAAPQANLERNGTRTVLRPAQPEEKDVVKFGIWAKREAGWEFSIVNADESTSRDGIVWEGVDQPSDIRIFAVDRVGNESPMLTP